MTDKAIPFPHWTCSSKNRIGKAERLDRRAYLIDLALGMSTCIRPRGRHREAPYEAVLGQMVTIRENGTERHVTAAKAFLLHLTKRGLEGDSAAARASLALIEEAGKRLSTSRRITQIVLVALGGMDSALKPLRMAKKLDRYRETARMALEPWLVEAALARLPQTLSPADQRIIVNATRTPHKVRWPEWWSEHP